MSTKPNQPIKLYRHVLSGHAHRVQLLLSLLDLPHELIDVDLRSGAHKQPDFLKLNPFGQVPVIDDGGVIVSDSNAILVYLASRYDHSGYLLSDPVGLAEVQRWLSVAAGQIASGPAVARITMVFGGQLDAHYDRALTIANTLFRVMDGYLHGRSFLVGQQRTIADVAAYSYIAHAPEGGASLAPYPNIVAWLKRVEALPGFVPMQSTKAGLLAE
jgi:glutathione S-transferase